jgi:FlaA1/EpsC-like NDP-sugar epimerase
MKQVQVALDFSVLVSAFLLAYLLRFDFAIPSNEMGRLYDQILYVVVLQFVALRVSGVYSFIWRYVGLGEIKAFLTAMGLSALPLVIIRIGVPDQFHHWRVPLSVIVMNSVLAFGGILGLRVLRRLIYESSERRRKADRSRTAAQKAVLLVGAGRAGVLAAREIQGRANGDLKIVGFVDDDSGKVGSVVHGVKVLGTTQDIPRLARELAVDHVVISIAEASRRDYRRMLEICSDVPVKVRVVPALYEILKGNVKVSRIRDLDIEDILGRESVQLEEDKIEEFLAGKTVMVTGAGGSIGSELARQVARFQPANLLLVERAEFALFDIDRELQAAFPDLSCIPLVADVSDKTRMRSIFATYRPQIVLHAAAHKHVPMMERNATEAIKNNILATYTLGELAGQFGVEGFVLMSTDKAVRPSSIMGAAKRVAELAIQELDHRFETRYVAVRFGNVMGSVGSVLPIFREQIRNGGPVTVTHPDMRRYFMTIPEATQLVLQAGAMGSGGEIFILDMGEPVRILDLAKDAIVLSGLRPFEDIDIVFSGVRSGEKLFEELEIIEEKMSRTRHPKIFIGTIASYPPEIVRDSLETLAVLADDGREQEIRRFLNELLPEATIDANGRSHLNTEARVAARSW